MIQENDDDEFNDIFLVTLKDISFAERQLLKALPKMAANKLLNRIATRGVNREALQDA